MDSFRRRQLGIKFGRDRLTKDDLRAEIAAIPADTPITVLPSGPRGESISVAQAQFNLQLGNLQEAVAGEVSQFMERCSRGNDLGPLIGLHSAGLYFSATGFATQLPTTGQDRAGRSRRPQREKGPKTLAI
jgi:hypothetical protein